jgi:hypothetical protein
MLANITIQYAVVAHHLVGSADVLKEAGISRTSQRKLIASNVIREQAATLTG